MILTIIPKFIFVWITAFLWHELCHITDGIRQGATHGNIYVELTTMQASVDMITDYERFKLAGGLYSGSVLLIMTWITSDPQLQFCFLTVAIANLYYSLFEMKYLGNISADVYKLGRYSIYFASIICMVIIEMIKW